MELASSAAPLYFRSMNRLRTVLSTLLGIAALAALPAATRRRLLDIIAECILLHSTGLMGAEDAADRAERSAAALAPLPGWR